VGRKREEKKNGKEKEKKKRREELLCVRERSRRRRRKREEKKEGKVKMELYMKKRRIGWFFFEFLNLCLFFLVPDVFEIFFCFVVGKKKV